MDKDLEKCGCGSDCGCGENNHECGCGGHDHNHDHDDCGCGCGENESFVIDLEDENGDVITCPIIDEFECEGNQYYLAQNPTEDSVYLFKLVGEELIVPEEDEFERVSAYYQDEIVGE